MVQGAHALYMDSEAVVENIEVEGQEFWKDQINSDLVIILIRCIFVVCFLLG